MGPTAARIALAAGVAIVLLTVSGQVGPGPTDVAAVAGVGLLVSAGAAAVGFASAGRDRTTALLGALLGLVPTVVLGWSFARSDG